MAYLINRNTSGRLPCLHGITQYIQAAYGKEYFGINDIKFNPRAKYNIHDFSPCAVKAPDSGIVYCRYLQNKYSPSKCALVQSVDYDPQKSKLASDIINALDGMALITREGDKSRLTSFGEKFAATKFNSKEWLILARDAVLNYGPFVGMLIQADLRSKSDNVRRADLEIGYPNTRETMQMGSVEVELSTGSQDDTNTRTRSVLLSYAVNTGYLIPDTLNGPAIHSDMWHKVVNDKIMAKRWPAYTRFFINRDIFPSSKLTIARPLSYSNLTKSVRSLRERGQEQVRLATMQADEKVMNRRFALAYLLANASNEDKAINFDALTRFMRQHEEFVVNQGSFEDTMREEIGTAFIVGLPVEVRGTTLKPLTKIDIGVLSYGAPQAILDKVHQMSKENIYG